MKIPYVFRLFGLILLIVLASKPVITKPEMVRGDDWAILLDASASMRVKDPTERLTHAVDIAKKLVSNYGLPVFEFSDHVDLIPKNELSSIRPVGKLSDLSEGLEKTLSSKKYRGAVVISDGREVGKKDALSQGAALGVPLLLVGVGNQSQFKDVSVRSVQGPPFAFKNVAASLSATVSVIGYPQSDVTVSLKEADRVISIQKIRVPSVESESTVSFSWTPTTVGTKNLTIEVSQLAGEATVINNRKEMSLSVGRDKFRVLYICGQPGPEYGFLRHQFKADPAVELVTFVILRNASNTVNIPETELSLIPFPTQDVLINQMATFDLVVFEEFLYQQYGLNPALVFSIRQKVEQGGSFLLMGGNAVFGVGSPYAIPGIQEMLPVETGRSDVLFVDEPYQFQAKALAHPILRLEGNPERNREIWSLMPPLDGVTLLPAVKSGATVLGTANIKGKEFPILSVWKYGKGRVATLSTRTTWRWSMLNGNSAVPSDAYQRFWKNMVLWLTHSDEFKSVRLSVENSTSHVGEKNLIRVSVFDDYFKPVEDADVRIKLTNPDGSESDLKPYAETTGVFAAVMEPKFSGKYLLQAWVTRTGKKFGYDSLHFKVMENVSEEEDLRPNFTLLKDLARTTGGQFVTIDQFEPSLFSDFKDQINKGRGQKILIWNSQGFLLVLIILFISEWVYRKRKGLP